MSLKGSRVKRTKNVRNLDADDAPLLEQSIIDKRLNIIPAGRQLQRTPPSKAERVSTSQPNKPDDSETSAQVIKDEPCDQEITKHVACTTDQHNGSSEVLEHPKIKEDRKSIRRSSSTAASATPGNADPEIFIQGMQGYQWTDTDLEFVYQTKWKKQAEQLQQELSDVQNSLKATRQLRDVALAAHDKIQTELSKVSSCERVQEMSKEILLKSQSCVQLEGLDIKGLLARLKLADVHRVTSEERTNISKLNQQVSEAQTMREKQVLLTQETDLCKVNIDKIKVNIHTLTADIAALESQLLGKEKAPQTTKPRQRGGPKRLVVTSASEAHNAPKPTTDPSTLKTSIASKLPTVPSAPKSSTAPKARNPSTAPKAPKPSTAPKAPNAPKPSKASIAPKPPTAPNVLEGDVGGLRRSKRIAAKKEK